MLPVSLRTVPFTPTAKALVALSVNTLDRCARRTGSHCAPCSAVEAGDYAVGSDCKNAVVAGATERAELRIER